MFRPRHHASDVALELAKGLSDGTITLDETAKPHAEAPERVNLHSFVRRELIGFAGLSSLLIALAAIVVERLPNSSEARSLERWQLAAEVEAHLNVVRRNGNPQADPNETRRLEQKLARTRQSSPEYWPTVFELVTIKTQGIVDLSRLKRPVFNLDLSYLPGNFTFEGQVVILSGSGELDGCRFIDCLVSFDLTPPASLYDIRFIRCSFFMLKAAATSLPVQRIATTLIAARDARDLNISIPG